MCTRSFVAAFFLLTFSQLSIAQERLLRSISFGCTGWGGNPLAALCSPNLSWNTRAGAQRG